MNKNGAAGWIRVVFLAALFAVLALSSMGLEWAGARPASQSFGTITIDFTEADYRAQNVDLENRFYMSWSDFGKVVGGGALDECANYESLIGGPINEFSVHLEIDLDRGIFTGSFEGSALCGEYTCSEEVEWGEGTFNGTMQGEVWPTNAWMDDQRDLGWQFEGTADITMQWAGLLQCYVNFNPLVATGYSGNTFTGEVKGDSRGYFQLIGLHPDKYDATSELLLDGWDVNLPAIAYPFPKRVPEGSSAGDATSIDLSEEVLENRDPELISLSVSPENPTDQDTVVMTVRANDPDGDALTYTWVVDGEAQSLSGDQTSWRHPPAGDHSVAVTISDSRGGTVEAFADFRVSEETGAGDRDDDGLPDDEDACPDEFSLEPDGCPIFGVTLGCAPAAPTKDQAVTCAASLTGKRPEEMIEYHWYRDSNYVNSSSDPSWGFGILDLGQYALGVQAAGEGRTADATFSLNVRSLETEEAEEIQDDPTAPFSLTLSCPGGVTSDENLDCYVQIVRNDDKVGGLGLTWVVNGLVAQQETVLDSAAYSLAKPPPGTHIITAQVVQQETGKARVATTSVEVEAGENINPFLFSGGTKIPPGAQVAAAVGTLSVLGAWFWGEWYAARRARALEAARDRWLEKDRQRWFDKEEKINAIERERLAALRERQQELKEEWQDLCKKTNESALKNSRDELLLDVLDRHYKDVYRDGVWDSQQLSRLSSMLGRMQGLMRYSDLNQALVKRQEIIRSPALEGLSNTINHKFTLFARVVTDVITLGAAEVIWMPLSASVRSLDARSVGLAKGLSGSKLGWSIFREGGKGLAADYLISKVLMNGVKAFEPELRQFGGWLIASTPNIQADLKALAGWIAPKAAWAGRALSSATPAWAKGGAGRIWQWLTTPVDELANSALSHLRSPPGPKIPVIKQSWKVNEPLVFVEPPTHAAGFTFDVPVGWVRKLEALRRISPQMADDVGAVMLRASEHGLDISSNNLLRLGQRFVLSADETVGLRLINNPGFRQALDRGLVPRQLRTLANVARDKAVKNAVMAAYERLAQMDDMLADELTRIDFTGTGARPRSASALSGWTDVDLTPRGSKTAETWFRELFVEELEKQGVSAAADVHMFSGLRPSPGAPPSGGYGSAELVHWQEVDTTFRGRSAIPTKGGMMFDAHPDVRPMPGQGQLDDVLRWTGSFDEAMSGARRLVLEHVDELPDRLGRPVTRLDILRSEGKHVGRVWWSVNRGTGAARPDLIRVLDRWKVDRTFVPDPAVVDRIFEQFVQYLNLSDEFRGIS